MDRLPQVHIELLSSKLASRSFEADCQAYKKIQDENPNLWLMIEAVVDDETADDSFKDGYCKAAVQFYSLLAAQLECDDLYE